MKPLKKKTFCPQSTELGGGLAYPVIDSNTRLLFRFDVIAIFLFITLVLLVIFELSARATSCKSMLGSTNAFQVEQQYCFDELLLNLSKSVEQYFIELKSSEFDTLLAVISPKGEIYSNCNYQGSANRSCIKLPQGSMGKWTVVVTSLDFKAIGDYELRVFPEAELTRKNKTTLNYEQLKGLSAKMGSSNLKNTKIDGKVMNDSKVEQAANIAIGGNNKALMGSISIKNSEGGSGGGTGVVTNKSDVKQAANIAIGKGNESRMGWINMRNHKIDRKLNNDSIVKQAAKVAIGENNQANMGSIKESFYSFPWPPPHASASTVLPRKLLIPASVKATFHDVDDRISAALERAGYSAKTYYSVPEGFALVTRLEQIDADGVPLAQPARWVTEIPPLSGFSLQNYICALFGARIGYFRFLVFIASSQPFAQTDQETTLETANDWLQHGANFLPEEIASKAYTQQHRTTALVFEFQKIRANNEVDMIVPGRFDADLHLRRAGFLPELEK